MSQLIFVKYHRCHNRYHRCHSACSGNAVVVGFLGVIHIGQKILKYLSCKKEKNLKTSKQEFYQGRILRILKFEFLLENQEEKNLRGILRILMNFC